MATVSDLAPGPPVPPLSADGKVVAGWCTGRPSMVNSFRASQTIVTSCRVTVMRHLHSTGGLSMATRHRPMCGCSCTCTLILSCSSEHSASPSSVTIDTNLSCVLRHVFLVHAGALFLTWATNFYCCDCVAIKGHEHGRNIINVHTDNAFLSHAHALRLITTISAPCMLSGAILRHTFCAIKVVILFFQSLIYHESGP